MLTFITGNAHKFSEVQAIIPEIQQLEIELAEIQELDSHRIIQAKLQKAFRHHAGEFIVEDTSLHFAALGGFPGPLIKWLLKSTDKATIAQIPILLGNPLATARTVIGYANSPETIRFFEGIVPGRIVEPRGESSFGWDTIFQPDGLDQTFAEMGPERKNQVSMRQMAARRLQEFLNEHLPADLPGR